MLKRESLNPGDKIGYFTIISINKKQKSKKTRWVCHCECHCGRMTNIDIYHLLSGHTVSCGCMAGKHPNARKTQFKEGQKPTNTLPIGTEILREDGYVWVKVGNTPGPHNIARRWIPRAHKVWLDNEKVLHDEFDILHLDGNPLNDDIDNLLPVTKAERAILNKRGLIYTDPELTKTGIVIAKTVLKIAERTKHGS